jgi:hypothetical protein
MYENQVWSHVACRNVPSAQIIETVDMATKRSFRGIDGRQQLRALLDSCRYKLQVPTLQVFDAYSALHDG